MILIIGGEGSGKRTYAESLGYTKEQMADAVIDERPVLFHLENLVSRDWEHAGELLEPLLKKEVVICNEVGSGVIPADRDIRKSREAAGRLCILLAQRASSVVRMVCGLPTNLK